MHNVEDILNKLYDYYEVSGASELAKKIGVSPQNISNWKARNSINPLKTIIRQNGIYEKIFGESILRNASDLVDRLMEYYDVTIISELAEKINIGHQAISKWRKNNSINAIKKRCRELGIYDEIFGDLERIKSIDDLIENRNKTLKKIETVEIKNKRLLYLIQQIDKYANEKEIKELLEILKDSYENIPIFNMFNFQKELNIIETMIKDNQELKNQFHQCLKDFIKDNL